MQNQAKNLIEKWSSMITLGQGKEVSLEMSQLIPKFDLNEDLLEKMANLTWRINNPKLGLKLITPYIKNCQQLNKKAKDEIYIEYIGCLIEVGAVAEARRIFSKNNFKKLNREIYFKALLLFKEWNYEQAQILLESYLASLEPCYHKYVVHVNFISALVMNEKFEDAIKNLEILKNKLCENKYFLLLGNCLEIESQIFFKNSNYIKALDILDQAESYLNSSNNIGWLYCKKWQIINKGSLEYEKNKTISKILILEFEEYKKISTKMKNWETLRELNLFESIFTTNTEMFNRVYFGSPFLEYRKKMLNLLKNFNVEIQLTNNIKFSNQNEGVKNFINLEKIFLDFSSDSLTFILKKCLWCLVRDQFSPQRSGQLFSLLWPEEFYDYENSNDRVFQLIKRLKEYLNKNKIELQIISDEDGYYIDLGNKNSILISNIFLNFIEFNEDFLILHKIKNEIGNEYFSSKDFSKKLDISQRTANRIITSFVIQNKLIKKGSGSLQVFKIIK